MHDVVGRGRQTCRHSLGKHSFRSRLLQGETSFQRSSTPSSVAAMIDSAPDRNGSSINFEGLWRLSTTLRCVVVDWFKIYKYSLSTFNSCCLCCQFSFFVKRSPTTSLRSIRRSSRGTSYVHVTHTKKKGEDSQAEAVRGNKHFLLLSAEGSLFRALRKIPQRCSILRSKQ